LIADGCRFLHAIGFTALPLKASPLSVFSRWLLPLPLHEGCQSCRFRR